VVSQVWERINLGNLVGPRTVEELQVHLKMDILIKTSCEAATSVAASNSASKDSGR
jgi:hypothetical protein